MSDRWMRVVGRWAQASTVAICAGAGAALASEPTPQDASFAALIDRLSEPSGYFDTDNLISNESSYLHVLDELDRLALRGGAYVGVGPDQNFSYMARVRPGRGLHHRHPAR